MCRLLKLGKDDSIITFWLISLGWIELAEALMFRFLSLVEEGLLFFERKFSG